MTDEIRGVRDRQWNYGNLHGLITGLNTAELYLKWANSPAFLQAIQDLLNDYGSDGKWHEEVSG